jgi:hypothetical protein
MEMMNSRPTGENQSLKEALEKQLHAPYKTKNQYTISQ